MKIHKIHIESSLSIKNINLAIGNFDGIHIGHQKVIKKLVDISNKNNVESAIMSFSPHPRQFFTNKYNNFNIISNSLKNILLDQLGVTHLILLEFNKYTASLSAKDFIEKILIKNLMINSLVVGYDFKFGKDRKGTVNLLKEKSLKYNYKLHVLKPEKLKKSSEIFSSSLIRKNIQEGNFKKVNSCLGRNWVINGIVITGDKKARKMNFPTANIIPNHDIVNPKLGVYAVKVKFRGKYHVGIANFGKRPTVDGNKLLLEVHLFDFNSNLYGKDLTVEFLTFIRDEKKFDNFDILTKQIQQDIEIAKKYHRVK